MQHGNLVVVALLQLEGGQPGTRGVQRTSAGSLRTTTLATSKVQLDERRQSVRAEGVRNPGRAGADVGPFRGQDIDGAEGLRLLASALHPDAPLQVVARPSSTGTSWW